MVSKAKQPGGRLIIWSTLAALVAILLARALGPGDLWDQTQPRTIAYSADILARGGDAWFLARDADGLHATKPPLYNWLAVPALAVAGRASEFAHRLPSVLAAIAAAFLLARLGERLGRGIGWLAALAWIAMFPTFKLAYLARPDMLLCLVMFVGWHAATECVLDARYGRRGGWARPAIFWLATIAAAWTKGPVAVLLPFYAIAASWAIAGSPFAFVRFRPILLGVPASALALGWYVIAAWLHPEHFRETLVYGEVVGRVSGNGPEGGQGGPILILTDLPVMSLYFLARFAPWSIAAILGALALAIGRHRFGAPWRSGSANRAQPTDEAAITVDERGQAYLWGAALFTLLVIGLFSLSSGKRADYIAPVYAPAALVAAWWMLTDRRSPVRRHAWIATLLAVVTLTAHVVADQRGGVIPRSAMLTVDAIGERALTDRAARPGAKLIVVAPQLPHIAVLCGDPAPFENTAATLREAIDAGEHVLALIGQRRAPSFVENALAEGRATELWSIEMPESAAKASITHGVRMIEFAPH